MIARTLYPNQARVPRTALGWWLAEMKGGAFLTSAEERFNVQFATPDAGSTQGS